MGVIASKVRFDSNVPPLPSIAEAVERRTGLTCTIARDPSNAFIVVKCREFATDIDLRIHGSDVDLEQPISSSVYFFDQLSESLVDLGGCRCDMLGQPKPEGSVPTPPLLWSDRTWTERFLDSHPVMTSFVWLAIMVPKGLFDVFRRRRK